MASTKATRKELRIEQKVSEYQSEFNEAHFTIAQIATEVGKFYNPRSRIIAIRLDDNIYWAYLIHQNEFPNPQKHNILWLRFSKVDEVPKNAPIPDEFPETMPFSIAFLIPKIEEPNLVDSTSTAAMTTDYLRDNEERQRVYYGRTEGDPSQRTGLVFNQDSGTVLLKGPGSEISLTESGVFIDGSIQNHQMEQKGLFEQNPLSFIIPETIVSFPASMKFLPNLNFIAQIGPMSELILSARSLLSAIDEL